MPICLQIATFLCRTSDVHYSYSRKKKKKNSQLSARHYPSSQPVSIVVEGSGHNVCQQVQQPAGLSSGAADHHFTIVDTPLLDRTARAACPLGTDITLPLGGTITQQIQKPPCSTAPWVQDGGPQPKACRVRGTYKSTGRHTVSLCFACDKRCFFVACYSSQTRKQPSAEVFEEDNNQACWPTFSAVGLAYRHG